MVASLRDAKRGLGVFGLLQSVASLAGCVLCHVCCAEFTILFGGYVQFVGVDEPVYQSGDLRSPLRDGHARPLHCLVNFAGVGVVIGQWSHLFEMRKEVWGCLLCYRALHPLRDAYCATYDLQGLRYYWWSGAVRGHGWGSWPMLTTLRSLLRDGQVRPLHYQMVFPDVDEPVGQWSHLSEMRKEVCGVFDLLQSVASLAGCVLCHVYHAGFT